MTMPLRARILAIVVPIAALIALLCWGISSPPGSGPDDDYHMASIWCAAGIADGICEAGATAEERRLPAELLDAARCFAFHPEQSASCDVAEGEMRTTERGNWAVGAYPPVFYSVMSIFVGEDFSASIILMRSVNALLYVGILTALYFLLPTRQRVPLLWGAAITAVPLGLFLIPSVNPSSWAVLSATGLWVAMWAFFEQTGPRKWVLAGVAASLVIIGAGARSDAAAYALSLIHI